VNAWRLGPRTRVESPASPAIGAATLPALEFHAEAGAPEGALYIDGVMFGHFDARYGVTQG
jgi:hypothetical protein